MRKYFGVAQDIDGNILPGATAQIQRFSNGVDAAIYEDDETTPLLNPITCDANGQFQFKVTNGLYNIIVSKDSYVCTYTEVAIFEDDSTVQLTNAEGALTLQFGDLCYVFGDGTVKKALTTGTEAQASVECMCMETLTPGSTGSFRLEGPIKGLSGGTAGAYAYLDPNGDLTTVVPTFGAGDLFSTVVGRWLSTTMLRFRPQFTIGL